MTGSGAGTVISHPVGVNCGTTCTAAFNSGTTITLTAMPNPANSFDGWSGACTGTASCAVTLNSASTVIANFSAFVPLTVSVNGGGTVLSDPPGINCPQTCSVTFASGTAVTLTAIPGKVLAGWAGACSGTSSCTVKLSSASSVTASFGTTLKTAINHIIFMLQENRSFDHYFGQLPTYLANNGYPQTVDGEPTHASNPSADRSGTVRAFHLLTQCIQPQSPFWTQAHSDYNVKEPLSATATLDGFVTESANKAVLSGYADKEGRRAIGYYDWNDLPYYYFMAANLATSDRWFSPVLSRTQPNRMYLLAATSAGHVHRLADTGSPRLTNPTIFDSLQNAGISWKIYVSDLDKSPPSLDTAMDDFESGNNYPQNFVPASEFASDLANGKLPQVAMIEPGYERGLDEHPPAAIQDGAHFASGFINDLMQSQYWKDSLLILSYDESGGYYDHVAPAQTVNPDGVLPSDLQPGDTCFGTGGANCDSLTPASGYRCW